MVIKLLQRQRQLIASLKQNYSITNLMTSALVSTHALLCNHTMMMMIVILMSHGPSSTGKTCNAEIGIMVNDNNNDNTVVWSWFVGIIICLQVYAQTI
jgi:hypothetical protein